MNLKNTMWKIHTERAHAKKVHTKKVHTKKILLKNRILAIVLTGGFLLSCYDSILASAIKDAQDKKSEAQQNLNEVQEEIDSIHEAQESLQEEMEAYDAQLMSLLTDMEILESDIVTQEEEIQQANTSLEQARMEESKQYELMKVRIQYMYENSSTSIWSSLLETKSITEFLNRVEYISEVYNYDRQLLENYQGTVQEVADLTEQLSYEMEEMEELALSYQEQQTSLEQVITAKRAELADFDSQLSRAEVLASKYAKTIRQQNQVIAAEKKRQEEEEKKRKEEEAQKNAANVTGTVGGQTTIGSNGSQADSSQADESETGSYGAESSETGAGGTGGSETGGSGTSGSSSNGLTVDNLNPSYTTGISGSSVVSYASQFLGNPYVLGGNSLTNGTDCSGFVCLVYENFGISLPRTSYELRSAGQAVSYANAQPGDIICYPGHVAIYIGDGKIIHASTPRTGICYGNATYRTITTIRRVL